MTRGTRRDALVRNAAAINLLPKRHGILVARVAWFGLLRLKIRGHVDHVLIVQRARNAGHDRVLARRLFRARLRLVVLQLLDDVLGMLACQLRKRAAGTVAVCSVTRCADLGGNCLTPCHVWLGGGCRAQPLLPLAL